MAASDEPHLHEASVARIPKTVADRKGAVLVARSMGYLLVRVLFHGAPVPGLKVTFGKISGPRDDAPEKLTPTVTTDADGIAFFPRLVPGGIYACQIERQTAAAVVPTVPAFEHPHPVVLPVGRPLVDAGDVDEFTHRPAPDAS